MTKHYNYALSPEQTTLPACRLGALGKARDFSRYAATTDKARVTCRACRKSLGLDQRSPVSRRSANSRPVVNLASGAR